MMYTVCKTSAALYEPSPVFGEFCLWSICTHTNTSSHRGWDVLPIPSQSVLELLRVCLRLQYMCVHACILCRHVCVCVCLSVFVCKSPATSQYHSSALSLHQRCHKIMWQGVNHAGAWGAMATRGFLAEHFCEQHQGEGNSRDHSTEQINLTTARSHTWLLFSTIPLRPLHSSNHSSGLNPEPCKKEPCGGVTCRQNVLPSPKRIIPGT